MKIPTNVVLFCGLLTSVVACGPDVSEPAEQEFSYEPVLMSRDVLEKAVRSVEPMNIDVPGKMYRYDEHLYISERYEGVHVIDNSDPSNPINKGFIRIPGCVDIAVQQHTLYANSGTDLIAVDISNLDEVTVKSRIPRLFPELTDPNGETGLTNNQAATRPENTEIINWIQK